MVLAEVVFMATLYVTEQGARIEKEYRRILVTNGDDVLLAVPAARVDHVVLVGRVGATTPALLSLLEEGVGLSLVNRWGKLRGRLLPAGGKNLALRRRQYERAKEESFCLAVSKAVVQGKLRNARNMARRLQRTRPGVDDHLIERIKNALVQTPKAADLAVLRGIEGGAAKAYFGFLRHVLDPEWAFNRRNRRPPTDPVNALLSLGYSLLTVNLMTACEIVGLDPYEGFLHADKYGRPALALDLVEEFRAVIVDSVVVDILNHGRLHALDFEARGSGGVYLNRRGARIFFEAYTHRLNTTSIHPLAGRALSYQKIFEVQARQLRKVIEGSEPHYRPFIRR